MVTNRINICGVFVDNYTMVEAVGAVEYCIAQKKLSFFVTPNVDHVIKLQSDKQFQELYANADIVLVDSALLMLAGRFLGTPFKEKISGSDITPELCKLAAQKGYKLFFLGGREGAAVKAKEALEGTLPGIQIVGTYCPPFGFEKDAAENKKIIELIKAAKPDILLVGLGAPKQEKWIYQYYQELGVPVSGGIGVTFEFIAGMVKRAPVWMQKCGLEWLWRLIMEPARLWRRYLVEDMPFFGLVLRQKFHAK